MAKGTMAVQVELIQRCSDTTNHTVTWIPAELKPKVGMILVEGKDANKRVWEVAAAYTNSPVEFESINTSWKVGGLG